MCCLANWSAPVVSSTGSSKSDPAEDDRRFHYREEKLVEGSRQTESGLLMRWRVRLSPADPGEIGERLAHLRRIEAPANPAATSCAISRRKICAE
jgi:hypothetical protein